MADLFQAVGGLAGCRKLSEAFYARVARDPVLSPIFPKSMRCAIEGLTDYLAESLGGPAEYSKNKWWASLREVHTRFKIGDRERDAWMRNMVEALEELKIEAPELRVYFEETAGYLAGHGLAPQSDQAVESIRRGEIPCLHGMDRALVVKLLAIMCGSGMHEHVCDQLRRDPTLSQVRYAGGWTLLHGAAAADCLPIVELLLQLGADPNATNDGGQTPVYRAGDSVGRTLVAAGADVNHPCMPLHQAARRGNVGVVEALLDGGANIHARDKKGDTPLQRAINCRKKDTVQLLLLRGAGAA
jgi:truncated hemoglobin YjbI